MRRKLAIERLRDGELKMYHLGIAAGTSGPIIMGAGERFIFDPNDLREVAQLPLEDLALLSSQRPFEHMWFEFIFDVTVCVDISPEIIKVFMANKNECMYVGDILNLSSTKAEVRPASFDERICDVMKEELADACRQTVRAIAMLNLSGGVDKQVVKSDPKLDAVRAKRGKGPLTDYTYVRLAGSQATGRTGANATGTSKRLHSVRGHFKRRRTGTYWWAPHFAGSGDAAPRKAYIVKKAPVPATVHEPVSYLKEFTAHMQSYNPPE